MAGLPEAGTPEYWERSGCEGANEYRDCESMSADYARLRRMERRVLALADSPPGDCYGVECIWPDDLRAAIAEPEVGAG